MDYAFAKFITKYDWFQLLISKLKSAKGKKKTEIISL